MSEQRQMSDTNGATTCAQQEKLQRAERFMRRAIELARQAAQQDEVPVGAVIVQGEQIIAEAANRKERDLCAVQHAEILALQQASKEVGNWYLDKCELFVTLEPCVMCAGAVINCRLKSVYFGATDPKAGGFGGLYDFAADGKLNHKPEVYGGILREECADLLSGFFKTKRKARI